MGNPKKLWIPAEKLDENVKRMAWLLFLEQWRGYIAANYTQEDLAAFSTSKVYANCLKAAKSIREMEQPQNVPAD